MEHTLYEIWRSCHNSPYHFPVTEADWQNAMERDIDGDGRPLFAQLITESTAHGLIQYGQTAFGFDEEGELSEAVHHRVIRSLAFDPAYPAEGEALLQKALDYFGGEERIHGFFHYFGMSTCGRHGKLHRKDTHVEDVLLRNGFAVEHENVYYARTLTGQDRCEKAIGLKWKELSAGACREFAASFDGQEIGWGQVHFLPQKDIAYLRWIYIDESKQHQGFGTAIMTALFEELFAMGIRRFDTDTALSNTAAQGYYEKTGFENCGITRSYYTK